MQLSQLATDIEIKDSNVYKSIGTYKRFTIKLDK